jgi:peptidoglycan/xylan/chitin deacetylase (PgdA/CDA1 family)
MAIGRREALVLSATALLSACAIEPPPTTAEPYGSHAKAPSTSWSPSAEPSTSSPATTEPGTSSLAEPIEPASPAPSEQPGTATPANTTPEPSPEVVAASVTGTNHIASANAYAVPAATVHTWLTTRNRPATKTAFLTFDDGPSVMTPLVLDSLKTLGVPATFFVIGRYLELNPAITQRAMAEGHAICLHSYSHDYAYLYPGRVGSVVNIATDYDHALSVAMRVLGPTYTPSGYRYPGGHMSWSGLGDADIALAQRGVSWIDWNCMSGDADRKPPANPDGAIANLTATFTAAGSPSAAVMLNHDSHGKDVTLATLPRFVQFFRDRGYGFGVIG